VQTRQGLFPVIGSYQVLTRITSQTHDVSSLASFTVIVPALQSASNLFGGNYIIWISLLFAAGAAGASFFILLISIHNPGPLVWSTQTSILSLALYINRTRKSTLPYSHVLARSGESYSSLRPRHTYMKSFSHLVSKA